MAKFIRAGPLQTAGPQGAAANISGLVQPKVERVALNTLFQRRPTSWASPLPARTNLSRPGFAGYRATSPVLHPWCESDGRSNFPANAHLVVGLLPASSSVSRQTCRAREETPRARAHGLASAGTIHTTSTSGMIVRHRLQEAWRQIGRNETGLLIRPRAQSHMKQCTISHPAWRGVMQSLRIFQHALILPCFCG